MKERLYIIGNGFDIHHGINSRYNQYLNWLLINDKKLYDLLLKYYPQAANKEWWNDFEQNLGTPDMDFELQVVAAINQPSEDCIERMSYIDFDGGANDVHEDLGGMITDIKVTFHKWVFSLNQAQSCQRLIINTSNALYLNFNYTNTLECVYGVPTGDILFIHGSVSSPEELVLGHGETLESIQRDIDPIPDYDGKMSPKDYLSSLTKDPITENTYQAAIEEIFSLRKDVKIIIERNQAFFQSLKNIKEIYIFGHSLSEIDMPYFEKVIKSVKGNNTEYIISYYNSEDYDKASEFIKRFCLQNHRLIRLSDIMYHRIPPINFRQ